EYRPNDGESRRFPLGPRPTKTEQFDLLDILSKSSSRLCFPLPPGARSTSPPGPLLATSCHSYRRMGRVKCPPLAIPRHLHFFDLSDGVFFPLPNLPRFMDPMTQA